METQETTETQHELKETDVSWLAMDPLNGDYIVPKEFTIKDHPGFGALGNKHEFIQYRTWQLHENGDPVFEALTDFDTGEIVLDDEDNPQEVPVMCGEYYLKLYLEHEAYITKRGRDGQPVFDDLGRPVMVKARSVEIIATDLTPVPGGNTKHIRNAYARKLLSNEKYEPSGVATEGGKKRGRKAAVQADVPQFQTCLGPDNLWHVIRLGQAEAVAKYPGNVQGRNDSRIRAKAENDALKAG